MKKALFILEDLNGTGSPLTVFHIIKNLPPNVKATVLVLCGNNGDDLLRKEMFERQGALIFTKSLPHFFGRKFKLFYKFYVRIILKTVAKLYKKEQFNYIYINRFNIAGPVFLWAHKKAKQSILIFNALGEVDLEYGSNYVAKLFNSSLKNTCHYCDYYLAISKQCFSHKYCIKGQKIVFQDYSDFPIKQGEKKFSKRKTINVGQIGYFSKNKNQLFSLSIVKELIDMGYFLNYHLIGFPLDMDYYQLITRFVKENNLENVVLFYDKEYDKKIFFEKIDLLLIPSISEGFPLVLKESLSQKTPVVGSEALPVEANFDGVTRLSLQNRHDWALFIAEESYKKHIDVTKLINDKTTFIEMVDTIFK